MLHSRKKTPRKLALLQILTAFALALAMFLSVVFLPVFGLDDSESSLEPTQTQAETAPETEPEDSSVEETTPPTQPETLPAEETVPETQPEAVETEPEASAPDVPELPPIWKMPLYNQLDYPNQRYGSGTVATSGCGITALAMVATYMTGHTYYPDELADYFGGYNGNNIERLLYASDALHLPYHPVENWDIARKELKEGKIAIILVGARSSFTDSQHFLVATGVTEDGRVWIHDPYGPNYSNPVLKDGFANGFPPGWISTGYSAAWVYDVDEMPEDPFIYVPEETPHVDPRYKDLELSDEDMELLARLVWAEARGEENDGQQAVAEVILNRVASDRFPNTVSNVIYAQDQFRGAKYIPEAEPTQTQYEAVERALYGPYILPMEVTHFATYPVNKDVWGTIGNHIFCYQWRPEN